MVTCESNIAAVQEQIDCIVDVLAPAQRVTNLCASWRVDVMQRGGTVLGHAHGAVAREIEVHLGWSFGPGGELELNRHSIDL
ncbi:unannotated protein [freshwater metagenome]|uniref:Unannotated protein n=1 Tax=freshwater metagenome TaxID=449393 RepID=A0A6J6QW08_9ZZZZ